MVVFLPDLEIQSYFAVTELAIYSFSGSLEQDIDLPYPTGQPTICAFCHRSACS
jgi:hypothetical protein